MLTETPKLPPTSNSRPMTTNSVTLAPNAPAAYASSAAVVHACCLAVGRADLAVRAAVMAAPVPPRPVASWGP